MKRPALSLTLVKIILLCLLDAAAVWGIILLGVRSSYALLASLGIGRLVAEQREALDR